MRVNLQIEDDEQFRKYVKEMISGEVRRCIRDQLAGIVAGEIAKVRLLQPNSPTLAEMVAKQIEGAVRAQTQAARNAIADEIRMAAKEAIKPHIDRIRIAIKEELITAVRNSL